MYLAAQGGHDSVVLALLHNGWKHGKAISGSNPPAVLLAAQNGHKPAIDVLFEHGRVTFQGIGWDIDSLIKIGGTGILEILLPPGHKASGATISLSWITYGYCKAGRQYQAEEGYYCTYPPMQAKARNKP